MPVETAAEFETYRSETEDSSRVVQAALDALNNGDAEGFLGSFADDLDFEMPGSTPVSGHTRNLEEFIALVSNVGSLVSEPITLRVTFFLAAGEWVVTRADGHGVTNDGKDYDNRYCLLWRVRDGRIIEFVEFNDTQLIMDVLCTAENVPAG
jgi:ketosteroid isomerase-like protein